jgi:carboxyl-terminal processing protease
MYSFSGLCFFVFLTMQVSAQTDPKVCRQIEKVQERLEEIHYQPVLINNEVQQQIMTAYLHEIDGRNQFFTTEDVARLAAQANTDGLCAAFTRSLQDYYAGIHFYDSISQLFVAKPVQFQKGATFAVNDANNSALRRNKARLAAGIRQSLTYKMLVLTYHQTLDDSLTFKADKDFTPVLEQNLRAKLAAREKNYIRRLTENKAETDKRLLVAFLNTLAMRFDPHSSFFSPDEKAAFQDELSRDQLSFGLSIFENENFEIEVSGILPGSAAWNSNEIHEEDIVESITDAQGVRHELSNRGMAFAAKLIQDAGQKGLVFGVRQKTNEKKDVKLIKSRVENVENAFTGYLLSDEKLKVGYIALPSFYTDFESDNQLGCANDVAKEILLLKKDGINGLILDLRGNGGGSLKEAVEICGLFIDEGPMTIYQGKNEKPYLLKDASRGTVYDGPLVILVDGLSASASEVVAGSMQDYGRALIVGEQTYGKGSAQSIFPVDKLAAAGQAAPNGYLKVTNGRFYHVSGRSNQETGITPEIRMQDLYSSISYFKEKNTPYHLVNDSTAKKVIYRKLESPFKPEILEKSRARVAVNPQFKHLKTLSDSLQSYVETDQQIPLELLPYLKYAAREDAFFERIQQSDETVRELFKVSNHAFAARMLDYNLLEKEFDAEVKEELSQDPVLAEVFSIFKDFSIFGQ